MNNKYCDGKGRKNRKFGKKSGKCRKSGKNRYFGKIAQSEILGLVVIVMIIAFGILFFTSRSFVKAPDYLKKFYTRAELSNNMLNSLLKTTLPECKGASVSDLYKDCATINVVYCVKAGQKIDSCSYAKYVTETIFSSTLDNWGFIPYRFSVFRASNPDEFVIGPLDKCNSAEKETALSPIPLNPGTLMVKLELCEQ